MISPKPVSQGRRFSSLTWLKILIVFVVASLVVGYQFLPSYDPVRAEAWRKAEPHVQKMNQESRSQAGASSQQIKEFFQDRKKNARMFAEDVLSFRGKWAYVQDFFSEGSHKRYLEDRFEANILSSDDLRKLLESVVTQYVSEVEGRENQMLVAIRADLDGDLIAAADYLPALNDIAEFRKEFDEMIQVVASVGQVDVGVQASKMIASEVAGYVITNLVSSLGAELGVSGSIFGTGALGAAETLGLSLIIAYIADQIINWAFHEAGYDPEAEIAAKVVESLDRLEYVLLYGSDATRSQYRKANFKSYLSWSSSDRQAAWAEACSIKASGGLGLVGQLQDIDAKRSNVRTEALRNLILIGVDRNAEAQGGPGQDVQPGDIEKN